MAIYGLTRINIRGGESIGDEIALPATAIDKSDKVESGIENSTSTFERD